MFTAAELVQPETLDEAYRLLTARKGNTVLGGCGFLRLGSKKIATAIDISRLGLDYISEDTEFIEVGAMATLRDLETYPALGHTFNGVLPKAVSDIVGVQFRNVATVGATVYSRYGFSDLLTVLLALETEVELVKGGRMTLEQFLDKPREKDILSKIFIKKEDGRASYQAMRNSHSDFPILTTAVSCFNGKWKVVVGARPGKARIAKQASLCLGQAKGKEVVEQAAQMAFEELVFGSNLNASASYRQNLCRALVKRAAKEVMA